MLKALLPGCLMPSALSSCTLALSWALPSPPGAAPAGGQQSALASEHWPLRCRGGRFQVIREGVCPEGSSREASRSVQRSPSPAPALAPRAGPSACLLGGGAQSGEMPWRKIGDVQGQVPEASRGWTGDMASGMRAEGGRWPLNGLRTFWKERTSPEWEGLCTGFRRLSHLESVPWRKHSGLLFTFI